MTGEEERIRELERMISELPKGYISVKNINGKQRHYLQWREGSKIRSKYIRKDDVEKTVEAIEQRRRFEAMLSELSGSGDFVKASEFDTNCAGRGKPPCCANSCSTCLPRNCRGLHT